jgi:DNA-binding transcriptional LysR family regulator
MELDHVEAFAAIVRHGGFTRASASLHLSQPAISRRIRLLEQELGAPLFERLSGGPLLTDAGHAFLPHAEALIASMRDGAEAVAALRGESGTVTLALVGTLASTKLTERLKRFRERHDQIELRIRTALSAEVSALVRRGDATLGLRYDHAPSAELVATTVYEEPMLPVCAPGHPLAGARTPKQLEGERWIAFPPRAAPEPYASALAGRLAAAGLDGAEIVPIDSLTAQKRMVEAGFGLALLPESALDDGTLHILDVPALRATLPVVLIRRKRAFEGGAAKALAALLSDWR